MKEGRSLKPTLREPTDVLGSHGCSLGVAETIVAQTSPLPVPTDKQINGADTQLIPSFHSETCQISSWKNVQCRE